ncbi:hypothetical protein N836_07875 [Leptolyngbya sp. Heron Island J]|uniref:FecR family protein n=1 Tax=Leptolyngbya sp. Heron Island J TaxID=1385935 RepID=UPI0003B97519|nr:FecR family protein [Leptolyngbya sp. Heron Island J]ESA36250.1 hypothetical protein N836_07875 [Leptolyngbya sp. Heron Island J]
MCKVSARWYSLLLGAAFVFGVPSVAFAQTSLTWARVERLRNRVHLIPSNRSARLARVEDVLNVGDALRTALSSRAELRFNDGSLARVGEQATFRFTPDTRNFQLSNGTVLLLIPPGRGRTTIQTPNAVTGIQGSALFVRVRCLADLTAEGYCSSPVTLVGALTNNPAGPMIAYNESGSQQHSIYAGQMIVIEGDTITQRHEFDLRTFYQTSGLVEGLQLDSPTPPETLSEDLQGVWQEIQDALELQGDFDQGDSAETVVVNPGFVAPGIVSAADVDGLNEFIFSEFPNFDASPAAMFHNQNTEEQVATSQPVQTYPTSAEIVGSSSTEDGSVVPVTSSRVRNALSTDSPVGQPAQPSAVEQPPVVTVEPRPVVPEVPSEPVVDPTPVVTNPVDPIANPVDPITKPGGELAPTVPPEPVAPPTVTPNPTVPETPNIPNETPNPGAGPTPIAADQDVVPTTPPPIAQPNPDITPNEPPPNVVPEADQVPDREIPPDGSFDWAQQQPPDGANNPEAVFPGLN